MVPHSPALKTSLGFVGLALVSLWFADIEVTTLHPWQELGQMLVGLLQPDFWATDQLTHALLQTLGFAFLGVAIGSTAGFALALVFHRRAVRWGCAFVRSIHELFWALIFIQVFGLNPLSGVLAIAIPFAGIFGKVFAEFLEEVDHALLHAVPSGTKRLSALFYAQLPGVWVHFKTYTLYRLECALRSSAVLGFIGLPTLGFHLQAAFNQGHYEEVSALLILFYALIATLRRWARPKLIGLYLIASLWVVFQETELTLNNLWRFFTLDVVPQPLRDTSLLDTATWDAFAHWLWRLLTEQAFPGTVATLILTQIALVVTGLLALLSFPLVSRQFFGPVGRGLGHLALVVTRSTPEYILAYVLLQLWGPSMLPAIVALALHNGAIIGHLIGHHSDTLVLRPDAPPRGLDRYSYELVPRLYGQFLAFVFYRWEILFRETAILGILGIRTLGFYVDSAIQELRFDRAFLLIVVTALLTFGIDACSRLIRERLQLSTTPHY